MASKRILKPNGLVEQHGEAVPDTDYGINITFYVNYSNKKYSIFELASYNEYPIGSSGFKTSTKLETGCRVGVTSYKPDLMDWYAIGY